MAGREILHVDMDAFFAAIEALDDPSLKGLPLIVGGAAERHGVVATASYEARKFGVHSAMPTATALKLCPQAILLAARSDRYAEISERVMHVLAAFTPLLEQVSVDEAFLDVTGTTGLFGPPPMLAQTIKEKIMEETRLTCSVGVAPNKFLAKLASDLNKPDGLTIIPAAGAAEFIAPLPVRRIWGIGPRTAEILAALGIYKIGDLANYPAQRLVRQFGNWAVELKELALGQDEREVSPDQVAKSMSRETTFAEFISDRDLIEETLLIIADDVGERLRADRFVAHTITLKVRDETYATQTRTATLPEPTNLGDVLFAESLRLLQERTTLKGSKIRLLGIAASGLEPCTPGQLKLFPDKRQRMAEAIDRVRSRFGASALVRGPMLKRDLLSSRGGWEGTPRGRKQEKDTK